MGLNLRVNTKAKVDKSSRKDKEEEELEPLSPTSEIFFNSEELPVYILAIFELEIPIDVSAVYAFLKDEFAPTSPRFSSIMIQDKKGKKMWKRVKVKVQDHVKLPIFPEDLSPESYTQHFDDYLSKVSKEQVPLDRPLWECHIMKYPTSHAGGVFIFKFHHAIADGVSLMGSLFSCFRRADDPSIPLTFPSSRSSDKKPKGDVSMKIFSIVPNFISSIFYFLYDFGQGVRRTFFEDDQTPIRSGKADHDLHSTRICTVTFSLNDVKRIKARLGVTVNDVVLGIIFLGTHLYKQEVDPSSRRVRSTAVITVNARSTKGYAPSQEMHRHNAKVPWGNKSAGFQVPIPDFEQDALANPLKFVIQPHKTFKRKRTSFGQYLLNRLIEVIMAYGGPKVAARIFYGVLKNSSLAISNMIGPIEQMSLAKHPINGFYFMLVGVKLVGLTVTVMSYMQQLRIDLGIEENFIDRQRLIKSVEEAFDMIFQAAMATSECSVT